MSRPLPIATDDPNKIHRVRTRPPLACVALVLQGGGAPGAYQAGVYEALAEADPRPDWVAGISIGAINAALIAGNAPKDRVAKLRSFWERISSGAWWGCDHRAAKLLRSDVVRQAHSQISAGLAFVSGAPVFFTPRLPPPSLHRQRTIEATSLYDTAGLGTTLEHLIDFDRINAGRMRFSVGSVIVRSGNFVYFDRCRLAFRPLRLRASTIGMAAASPIRPSNVSSTASQGSTSLPSRSICGTRAATFRRPLPMFGPAQKETQHSSHTRASTDFFKYAQRLRRATADLLDKLPKNLRQSSKAKLLREVADRKVYNIVHLIYRARNYVGHCKDFEFSRTSMDEHWRAGYHDAVRTLRHHEVLEPTNHEVVFAFNLHRDGRE